MDSISVNINGQWVKSSFTHEEKVQVEEIARRQHTELYENCIERAKALLKRKGYDNPDLENILLVARELYKSEVSHTAYIQKDFLTEKAEKR